MVKIKTHHLKSALLSGACFATIGVASLIPSAARAQISEVKPLDEPLAAFEYYNAGNKTGCSVPYIYENDDVINLVYNQNANKISVEFEMAEPFFVDGHSYLLALLNNESYEQKITDLTAPPNEGSDRLYKIAVSSPQYGISRLGSAPSVKTELGKLHSLYLWNSDKSRMFHVHNIQSALSQIDVCAGSTLAEQDDKNDSDKGAVDVAMIPAIAPPAETIADTQPPAENESVDEPQVLAEIFEEPVEVPPTEELPPASKDNLAGYLQQAAQDGDFELVESLAEKLQILEQEKEALRAQLSSFQSQPLSTLKLDTQTGQTIPSRAQDMISRAQSYDKKINVLNENPYPEPLKTVEIQKKLTESKPNKSGWVNLNEFESRVEAITADDEMHQKHAQMAALSAAQDEKENEGKSFFERINIFDGWFGDDNVDQNNGVTAKHATSRQTDTLDVLQRYYTQDPETYKQEQGYYRQTSRNPRPRAGRNTAQVDALMGNYFYSGE